MEELKSYLNKFIDLINSPLLTIGETVITPWLIVYFILLIVLLIYISKKIRNWLTSSILVKSNLDSGTINSIGTITRYLIIVIGLFIILQSIGIDLSTLTILAGALGVGIGFGLQNITNNLVSGIIILFERPIKVGDRIQVEDIVGDVVKISMRATTIVTNDNISIIIPNSDFISSRVINWSHNDRNVRFNIPLGVSYSENPLRVKEILLEVAKENPNVLEKPASDVIFTEFGDSSLNFKLRVWTSEMIQKPKLLISDIYFEIFKRFHEEGIKIPFPQRDIHIKSKNTSF